MLADVVERLVDPGCHEARRVGVVGVAGHRTAALRPAQGADDGHEEFESADVCRDQQLLDHRPDCARCLRREQHAAPAQLQHRQERRELRQEIGRVPNELLVELQNASTQRHRGTFGHVADPVVRKVRPGQYQMARCEFADEVADEAAPRGRDDVVKFALGVKVPTHRPERVAVLPRLERLGTIDLNELEVRFHRRVSRRLATLVGFSASCLRGLAFRHTTATNGKGAPHLQLLHFPASNDTFLLFRPGFKDHIAQLAGGVFLAVEASIGTSSTAQTVSRAVPARPRMPEFLSFEAGICCSRRMPMRR